MSAPIKQTPTPIKSHISGENFSTPYIHTNEQMIYIPPYMAYARPADAVSIRVKIYANANRQSIAGMSNIMDFPALKCDQNK